MRFLNLTGQRFGRLLVVERGLNKGVKVCWRCVCDCGRESLANAGDLRSGRHASCGCLQLERVTKHGHSPFDSAKKSPTYRTWLSMSQRCTNPQATHFNRYGGRGLTVCERWRDFEAFLADMGHRPAQASIDRFPNSDGNYEPGNCRWATRKQQSLNRTNNRRLTHDGITLTVSEWAARLGVAEDLIRGRLKLGWSDTESLTLPVLPQHERALDPETGQFLSRRQ